MGETLALRYCVVNSVPPIALSMAPRYRPAIMDIVQIRKARLLWLAQQFGGYREGGFANLGKRVGKDPNIFSQIHTGVRAMGNRLARYLEQELGLPHGTMDTPLEEDLRRKHIEDMIRAALGGINPEYKGPVRHQPRPLEGAKPPALPLKGETAKGLQSAAKRAGKKRGR